MIMEGLVSIAEGENVNVLDIGFFYYNCSAFYLFLAIVCPVVFLHTVIFNPWSQQ